MESPLTIEDMSPEEIEVQTGLEQRLYHERLLELQWDHQRRMQELQTALNEARERERRERIERDSTSL